MLEPRPDELRPNSFVPVVGVDGQHMRASVDANLRRESEADDDPVDDGDVGNLLWPGQMEREPLLPGDPVDEERERLDRGEIGLGHAADDTRVPAQVGDRVQREPWKRSATRAPPNAKSEKHMPPPTWGASCFATEDPDAKMVPIPASAFVSAIPGARTRSPWRA